LAQRDNASFAVTKANVANRTEDHMTEIASLEQTPPKTRKAKTRTNRDWARDLLTRSGRSQRELAQAWGCSDSSTSRWLDGQLERGLTFAEAATFCRLTGVPIEELAARLGLVTASTRPVRLAPINDPPLPTIRITPAAGKSGRWLFLAHIEVGTDALAGITNALDDAASNRRVERTAQRNALTAKLAEPA
jgi:hypothetical protein